MDADYAVTETLDVQGASCPMPVVKTKQMVDTLESGAILEVLATDAGSTSDMQGWAEATPGVELLEQVETEAGGDPLYKHYVRLTDE